MKGITTSDKKYRKWLALLFWLAVWQLAGMCIGEEILLATPLSALKSLAGLLPQPEFWKTVSFSMTRIAFGFFLAASAGTALGVIAARSRAVELLLSPLLSAVKATPVASFIIVVLIWVPSKNLSVLISFLMAFPVIYLSMLDTVRQLRGELREMALVFRVPRGKQLRYLYLPEILPRFRGACSAALGLAWKAGVAAEVIGIPEGSLGERLYYAKIYLNTPELFAWTTVIVLLSAVMEKLVLYLLESAEKKWGRM